MTASSSRWTRLRPCARRASRAVIRSVEACRSAPQTSVSSRRVEHLSKSYGTARQPVTALDDVSIGLRRGEFTAIMGPSGLGQVDAHAHHGRARLRRPRARLARRHARSPASPTPSSRCSAAAGSDSCSSRSTSCRRSTCWATSMLPFELDGRKPSTTEQRSGSTSSRLARARATALHAPPARALRRAAAARRDRARARLRARSWSSPTSRPATSTRAPDARCSRCSAAASARLRADDRDGHARPDRGELCRPHRCSSPTAAWSRTARARRRGDQHASCSGWRRRHEAASASREHVPSILVAALSSAVRRRAAAHGIERRASCWRRTTTSPARARTVGLHARRSSRSCSSSSRVYVGAVVTANTFATIIAGRTRTIALLRLIGSSARSQREPSPREGLLVGMRRLGARRASSAPASPPGSLGIGVADGSAAGSADYRFAEPVDPAADRRRRAHHLARLVGGFAPRARRLADAGDRRRAGAQSRGRRAPPGPQRVRDRAVRRSASRFSRSACSSGSSTRSACSSVWSAACSRSPASCSVRSCVMPPALRLVGRLLGRSAAGAARGGERGAVPGAQLAHDDRPRHRRDARHDVRGRDGELRRPHDRSRRAERPRSTRASTRCCRHRPRCSRCSSASAP